MLKYIFLLLLFSPLAQNKPNVVGEYTGMRNSETYHLYIRPNHSFHQLATNEIVEKVVVDGKWMVKADTLILDMKSLNLNGDIITKDSSEYKDLDTLQHFLIRNDTLISIQKRKGVFQKKYLLTKIKK